MPDAVRPPGVQPDKWEWQLFGACRSEDVEKFFHPDGERGANRPNREVYAKAICATCPLLVSCRAYVLSARERYGVWGGLSECERGEILGTAPATA